MTRQELLAQIASRLSGSGVEFGAGAYPFPATGCHVRFADRNTQTELRDRKYFGDAKLIEPDLISDLETMDGISDNSLNFIIASHVIEHTRNPLLALENAYRKLRHGGQFVLVVPDMVVTFDRDRQLTPLEHLTLDYADPSNERDFHHYVEFFEKSFPQPDPLESARSVHERGDDIHFHTWTYESFQDMVKYSLRSISPWVDTWYHPRLSDQDIEFYAVLRK